MTYLLQKGYSKRFLKSNLMKAVCKYNIDKKYDFNCKDYSNCLRLT